MLRFFLLPIQSACLLNVLGPCGCICKKKKSIVETVHRGHYGRSPVNVEQTLGAILLIVESFPLTCPDNLSSDLSASSSSEDPSAGLHHGPQHTLPNLLERTSLEEYALIPLYVFRSSLSLVFVLWSDAFPSSLYSAFPFNSFMISNTLDFPA